MKAKADQDTRQWLNEPLFIFCEAMEEEESHRMSQTGVRLLPSCGHFKDATWHYDLLNEIQASFSVS